MSMSDDERRRAYELLSASVRSGTELSLQDIRGRLGPDAPAEPLPRELAPYVQPVGGEMYRVVAEFRRVGWEEFQELADRATLPLASYRRATYESVVIYDLFLPLTREDKLRATLDQLFYRDALEQKIAEIGLDTFMTALPRGADERQEDYVRRIVDFVAERIEGFSISHVRGRFRSGRIRSRHETAEAGVAEPYLAEETSAVVRFVVPCLSSRTEQGSAFDFTTAREPPVGIEDELKAIRTTFFELFVEALVPSVRGEKRIWLLELAPDGRRLYELCSEGDPSPAGAHAR